MYGEPAMTCFKSSRVPVWLRSHCSDSNNTSNSELNHLLGHVYTYNNNTTLHTITYLFCYTLSGYKDSTMSHQTAPPHYRQPSPPLYNSITFTHLQRWAK